MFWRLTALLFVFFLTPSAWAQTAKPANPSKISLEIMVVTLAADTRQGGFDEDLLSDIASAVKSHESKPWSVLQGAIGRLLPKERDSLASAIDAYTQHTFPDLEQRVNFATAFAGGHDSHRGSSTIPAAQTKVTAVPWILDEERFGLGVTVLSEVPMIVSGHHPPREREQTEMTSNTLVNDNEASIIMSRSHKDAHVQTLLLVIARVSR
ncbi:hypothetical protein Pan97_35170 [Bremerella volcania]|uniref:Uncharacterized protein n=1 Tax=Bremerella volcania TaxID=2527984 RepID=A0A518CB61_9BACT|nr:hypothetical protein [Bremerella volcania]QDU76467.1 hypothetical protein Pan97_35170 [Bremerella volcania]